MTAKPVLYVVDDEAIIRESIMSLIAAHGAAECREYVDGSTFIAALDDLEPGCVVLDLQLNGTSGATVMQALAQRPDRFRTIVVTGMADLSVAIEAFQAGAVDFLFKPYEIRPLLAAIDRAFHLIQHGSEPAEAVAEARGRMARLQAPESDILARLIAGQTNQDIAIALGLDERAVQIHRARALAAIEAPSILAAMRMASIAGWPDPSASPAG